jgi:hypothetical protein
VPQAAFVDEVNEGFVVDVASGIMRGQLAVFKKRFGLAPKEWRLQHLPADPSLEPTPRVISSTNVRKRQGHKPVERENTRMALLGRL